MLVHHISAVGVWSVNPYQGCAHRCIYCIAGSQGESVPWHDADTLLPALREGLAPVPVEMELFFGGMVDAYPPVEAELGLTRLIVQELIAQRRPFCLNTKSDLVCREIDLLRGYPGHCDVCLSLCTLNEEALACIEPGAPSAAARLAAVRQLCDAGIETIIEGAPWIPGISDTNALLAVRPAGVPIHFAPLEIPLPTGAITLCGHRYMRQEINDAYQQERSHFSGIDDIIWKDPLPRG